MSWSLASSLHQPPTAPTTTYVVKQPQDVWTQLSRDHCALFTCLEWMHSGRVDHHHPQKFDYQRAFSSHLFTGALVMLYGWVAQSVLFTQVSCTNEKTHDGQTCWILCSLMSFNSLKIGNLHTRHQLVIVLPISVFLFNFGRIIHWKSIHF